MADIKTTKQITKEIEKQQKLLQKLDSDSVKYKNTQKEIVRLQTLAFEARARESEDLRKSQPLYKQIESSIQSRLKKTKELKTQDSFAANLQKESQKSQGMLLENIQRQISSKGKLNDASAAQLEILESINLGTNDVSALNQQIAESEERSKSARLKYSPLVKADEEALTRILKGEKRRLQFQSISNKLTSLADNLSGGMVNKAQDFGKFMGMSPKNLARLGVAGLIVGVLVKAATQFSAKIDEVGKTFGFITNQSPAFRNDLIDAGNEAMMVGKNLGDVLTVASTLSSEFGISLDETRDIADTVLDTAVATGLSTDEATKLFGTFMQIGNLTKDQAENLAESTAQLAFQRGVAPRAVLQDMAGSAEEIAKFTKGSGENIAEAAIQARQMGISLQTTAQIAEGLLDFETSINKEVEASVMLGKNLNFQRARQLALQGDMTGMMDSVLKQLGGEQEFLKLNVLQRKSIAASLGVSVAQMSKLVAGADKLTLKGALAGKNFDDLVGQDALSGLTSIINSIKMIGAALMDELGKPIADMLKVFQESIMTPQGMKEFKNDIIGFINSITGFINGILSFAEIFTTRDMGRIGEIPMVNDFKASPGKITHVMGPGGIASVNPRDTIIGGTRLNDFYSAGEGSISMGGDTAAAIDRNTAALTNLKITAGRGTLSVALDEGLGGGSLTMG